MPRRGKGACRSPTPSRVPSRRRQTQSRRGRRPAGRGPSRAAQTESAREVYRFSQKSWHTCRGRECSTRIEIRSSRIWEFFASRRKSAVVCKNGKWKSFDVRQVAERKRQVARSLLRSPSQFPRRDRARTRWRRRRDFPRSRRARRCTGRSRRRDRRARAPAGRRRCRGPRFGGTGARFSRRGGRWCATDTRTRTRTARMRARNHLRTKRARTPTASTRTRTRTRIPTAGTRTRTRTRSGTNRMFPIRRASRKMFRTRVGQEDLAPDRTSSTLQESTRSNAIPRLSAARAKACVCS